VPTYRASGQFFLPLNVSSGIFVQSIAYPAQHFGPWFAFSA
jgi:hypothetical protein